MASVTQSKSAATYPTPDTHSPESFALPWASRLEVEVRPTPLGSGVFALRTFRRGEVIGEVRGQVLYGSQYGSDYCMDLGDDCSLEPDAPFRFLNHNCQASAELFQYDDSEPGARHRMWIHALRKIPSGTQITIDYCWPASVAIACRCESPKCRGWIVDPAELELIKRREKKSRKKK